MARDEGNQVETSSWRIRPGGAAARARAPGAIQPGRPGRTQEPAAAGVLLLHGRGG